MRDEQRKCEKDRKRERERQRDRYSTEVLTNGPQKGGEMRHLLVVGATVGHHEKAVRAKNEGERKRAKEWTSAT